MPEVSEPAVDESHGRAMFIVWTALHWVETTSALVAMQIEAPKVLDLDLDLDLGLLAAHQDLCHLHNVDVS